MLLALRSLWEETVQKVGHALRKKRRRRRSPVVVWKPIPASVDLLVAENVVVETNSPILLTPRIAEGQLITNNVTLRMERGLTANLQIATGHIETGIDLLEDEWIALLLLS